MPRLANTYDCISAQAFCLCSHRSPSPADSTPSSEPPKVKGRSFGAASRRPPITDVTYTLVEHDGGWAYKVGDTFSETFPTHDAALAAAKRAAGEQRAPGETEGISYEDKNAVWHEEVASGDDRPTTHVRDAE